MSKTEELDPWVHAESGAYDQGHRAAIIGLLRVTTERAVEQARRSCITANQECSDKSDREWHAEDQHVANVLSELYRFVTGKEIAE